MHYREPGRTYWGEKAFFGAVVVTLLLTYPILLPALWADIPTASLAATVVHLVMFLGFLPGLLLIMVRVTVWRTRMEVTEDCITLPDRIKIRRGLVVSQVRSEDVRRASLTYGDFPDPRRWLCLLTLTDGSLLYLESKMPPCRPEACRIALTEFVERANARRS